MERNKTGEQKRPDMGVAVIVKKDNKVLMCERYKPDKSETWHSFPGGRMEFGESFEDTAVREIKEETNLDIKIINKNPVAVTNEVISEDKHHITLFLEAVLISGELKIMEPEKVVKFEWFSWDNLPASLSPQAQNLIKTDYKPFKQK